MDDKDLATLLRRINERERTAFHLLRRYATGEAGAYAVEDASGRRAVLKWHPDPRHIAAVQVAMAATERLRTAGYPAPEYLHAGALPDGTYALQETLHGEPMAAVTYELLPRLLELNAMQVGIGAGLPGDWPHPVTDPVLFGGDGFCLLEPMQAYAPETAQLLSAAQAYVRAYAGGTFATGDIVHMDFNPANILAADGEISGVVDWEDCCAGDCSFGLATLMFYAYDDAAVRGILQRHILERASPIAMTVYLSHMIVRQVDWSIRHHDAATVARYIGVSQRILMDLAGILGPLG